MGNLRISRVRGLIPTRELLSTKWTLRLRRPSISWRRRITRDYRISLLLWWAAHIISTMRKMAERNLLLKSCGIMVSVQERRDAVWLTGCLMLVVGVHVQEAVSVLVGTVHIRHVEVVVHIDGRPAGRRQVGDCHVEDAEIAVHRLRARSTPSHLRTLP